MSNDYILKEEDRDFVAMILKRFAAATLARHLKEFCADDSDGSKSVEFMDAALNGRANTLAKEIASLKTKD